MYVSVYLHTIWMYKIMANKTINKSFLTICWWKLGIEQMKKHNSSVVLCNYVLIGIIRRRNLMSWPRNRLIPFSHVAVSCGFFLWDSVVLVYHCRKEWPRLWKGFFTPFSKPSNHWKRNVRSFLSLLLSTETEIRGTF